MANLEAWRRESIGNFFVAADDHSKLGTIFEMTQNEALMEYRSWLRASNYRPDTITNYIKSLRPFWVWLAQEGVTDLRSVTRALLERYVAQIRVRWANRRTQESHLHGMKRLFHFLVEANHLLIDPAAGLSHGVKGRSLPRPVLTPVEMKKLLAQPNTSLMHGIRDRAFLELFYSTGIRMAEGMALTVYDLDLAGGLLRVRSGKGGRGRVVPVGKEAMKWLKEYLTKIRPRQNRFRSHERALFLTPAGRPMARKTVWQMVRRYAKAARIKKQVTCHVLRHTCATHLLEGGADLVAIKELLGHRKLSTTQIYTRVRPVDVKVTHKKTHPREAMDN